MPSGAKNHRFRGGSAGDPGADQAVGAERRTKRDRRDAARTTTYAGVERRRGPRREGDLPTPVWRRPLGLAIAIGLGVAAGLAVDSLQAPPEASLRLRLPQRDPHGEALAAAVREAELDPQLLARAQALRDEARALTVAEVTLDERAHERWMPRVAKIEQALEDPATPEPIRIELLATIAALECVGVLEHARALPGSDSCVTLQR